MVNVAAVLIANLMALVVLSMVVANCMWRLKQRNRESRVLLFLIVLSSVSCIADCTGYLIDGMPGCVVFVAQYAINTWIYAMNMIIGPLWLTFLATYLHVRLPQWVRSVSLALAVVFLGALVVNLFVPIAFTIDSANVYHREFLYPFYVGVSGAFLVGSLVVYSSARKQGGMLKFFPVWVFMIPAILGVSLQVMFYGVSTTWPFIAIAVSGVMSGLQNELIFRDKLTGLYNRFYLDDLKSRVSERADARFSIVMMDLNNFKSINDTYGHAVGDKALIATGAALSDAVGTLGTVMRYAGDEFVALLNTQDEETVNACIARIHRNLELLNDRPDIPYRLSISAGSCPVDLSATTVDEALNRVDLLMYQDKHAYYQAAGHDRRAGR